MKVGIVGCGTIGKEIISSVISAYKNRLASVYIYDVDCGKMDIQKKKYSWLKKAESLSEIVFNSDFLIEAASGNCVKELIPLLLKNKKDVLIMSTGGLLEENEFFKKALQKGIEVVIPGGAIAGLDAIKAMRGSIKSITLSSYKPIRALASAPYCRKNPINFKNIKTEKLIFQGNVKSAVLGFPKSINVSATLLLTSGLRDINVKIFATKNVGRITHIIEVKSEISTLKIVCKNYPSKTNPKTSALAVYSACSGAKEYLLRNIRRR